MILFLVVVVMAMVVVVVVVVVVVIVISFLIIECALTLVIINQYPAAPWQRNQSQNA